MRFLIILTLAVAFTAPSHATSDRRNQLIEDAQSGNLESQYSLAISYLHGEGFDSSTVDEEKGLYWLRTAAGNGHLPSQFALTTYADDIDQQEKNALIRRAAEGGHAPAQLAYGKSLPDKVMGLEWIITSANQGYANAQYFIGELYRTENNDYVTIDYEKAVQWLVAVAEGTSFASDKARLRLAMMYETGDGVERDLKESSKWLLSLDERQQRDTDMLLGFGLSSLRFGRNSGLIALRIAAERNHADAQQELAHKYRIGWKAFNSHKIGRFEIDRDIEKAITWYKHSARNGNVESYYNLGYLYDYGAWGAEDTWDLKPDGTKAIQYYRWAANEGDENAQERLDQRRTYSIGEWKTGSAFTRFTTSDLGERTFRASIGRSKSGEVKLYFDVRNGRSDMCDPDNQDDHPSNSVWIFGEQPVSMTVFCSPRRDNSEYHSVYATAATRPGTGFVIETFKKRPEAVNIEAHGYTFPISAVGFTKAWRHHNKSAL